MANASTIEEALAVLKDPNETTLNFAGARLGPEDAKRIAEALPHSQITKIYLYNNNIGDEGAAYLAQALPQSQVTNLDLSSNQIGDEGMAHLARLLPQSRVRALSLNRNNFGDEGVAHLVGALPLSRLERLYLDHNQIGDEGVAHIARALPKSRVSVLYLDYSQIGDKGAAYLAQALPLSQLAYCKVLGNNIGDVQRKTINAQVESLWEVANSTAEALKSLMGPITLELWRDISRFPVAVRYRQDLEVNMDTAFQSALDQGFPVQEFVLKTMPTKEAVAWLQEHKQPIPKIDDLLAEDLSLPEENHYAAAKLVYLPDAWESKARAVHVRRQLPEGLRDILPWQELYLALHRRTQITETQR